MMDINADSTLNRPLLSMSRPRIPGADYSYLSVSLPKLDRSPIPSAKENTLAASLPSLPTPISSLLDTINHELRELSSTTALYAQVLPHPVPAGSNHSVPADQLPPCSPDGRDNGTMSTPTAAVTFLKAMLGPLLLYAPHMFAEGGLVFASVMFLIVGVLSTAGMFVLVEMHDAIGARGKAGCGAKGAYAQIGRLAVGKAGFYLVEGCIACSQWLYCVGYPIFVARNVQQVLAAFVLEPPSIATLTVAQLPVLVPYCWVRDIRHLGPSMLVANTCLWGCLAIILWLVCSTLVQNAAVHRMPTVGMMGFGSGALLFTAQAVVAFEGIALVLPIREAMRTPTHFHWLMFGCMTVGTLTLLLTGAGAYLAFGEQTATFVTLNIEGPPGLLVRAIFALAVVLTYPLQLFPAMQALEVAMQTVENMLGVTALGHLHEDGRGLLLRQCVARSCLVVAAFVFALYVPYDNLIALAGGLCAVPLAFIFPGWFHLRVCRPKWSSRAVIRAFDIILIVFGSIMAPVAVSVALISWR